MQGYVGATVNISSGVHGMLERWTTSTLAFTPRGDAGINRPLARHLRILGHTMASRGIPQDGADLHVTCVRSEALGRAFSAGDTILSNCVMEEFAVADRPAN